MGIIGTMYAIAPIADIPGPIGGHAPDRPNWRSDPAKSLDQIAVTPIAGGASGFVSRQLPDIGRKPVIAVAPNKSASRTEMREPTFFLQRTDCAIGLGARFGDFERQNILAWDISGESAWGQQAQAPKPPNFSYSIALRAAPG